MLKIEIVRTRQVEMDTNMPTQAFCPRWGKRNHYGANIWWGMGERGRAVPVPWRGRSEDMKAVKNGLMWKGHGDIWSWAAALALSVAWLQL